MNKASLLFLILPVMLFAPMLSDAALVECMPTFNPDPPCLVESPTAGVCEEYAPMITEQCTVCDFITLGDRIIRFMLFGIAIPVTVFMVAWGAFRIMIDMGNTEGVKQGKGIITAAIVGLVIAFIAWILIATMFRFLTPSGNLPWQGINCTNEEAPTI